MNGVCFQLKIKRGCSIKLTLPSMIKIDFSHIGIIQDTGYHAGNSTTGTGATEGTH